MSRRFPEHVYGQGADPDPRLSLANERTFLAWTRTALALVAGAVAVHSPFFDFPEWVRLVASLWLLLVAVLCLTLSWRRWRAVERAMRTGAPMPGFGGPTVVLGSIGLLVVSVAVGVVVAALR